MGPVVSCGIRATGLQVGHSAAWKRSTDGRDCHSLCPFTGRDCPKHTLQHRKAVFLYLWPSPLWRSTRDRPSISGSCSSQQTDPRKRARNMVFCDIGCTSKSLVEILGELAHLRCTRSNAAPVFVPQITHLNAFVGQPRERAWQAGKRWGMVGYSPLHCTLLLQLRCALKAAFAWLTGPAASPSARARVCLGSLH